MAPVAAIDRVDLSESLRMVDPQMDQVIAGQARKQSELAPAQGAARDCRRSHSMPEFADARPPSHRHARSNQSATSTRHITRNRPARRCQLT